MVRPRGTGGSPEDGRFVWLETVRLRMSGHTIPTPSGIVEEGGGREQAQRGVRRFGYNEHGPGLPAGASSYLVEAAGIEPASENGSTRESTCVAWSFYCRPRRAPTGRDHARIYP